VEQHSPAVGAGCFHIRVAGGLPVII
jgi:hypothetical protein